MPAIRYSMSAAPKISVIVPVHNREKMVGEAIASVLCQTESDFEIIVVDDGSIDRSVEVVQAIGDPRIRLIAHERNRGIPATRNSGLEAAKGRYIAWLDSDDLARPNRLKVQADYLERHPMIALVGAHSGVIRADGKRKRRVSSRPLKHEQIVAMLLFRTPLLQSTFMGRTAILQQFPYRREFAVSEDLDLLIRLARKHRIANLHDVLVDRRSHAGQVVRNSADRIVESKRELFRDSLARLGIQATEEELARHIVLGRLLGSPVDCGFIEWSKAWLDRILEANQSRSIYDHDGLDHAVRRVWRRACIAALAGEDRMAVVAWWARRLIQLPVVGERPR